MLNQGQGFQNGGRASGFDVLIKCIKIIAPLGSTVAVAISYTTWNSIGWAVLHGIFGWFYVLYFAIVH